MLAPMQTLQIDFEIIAWSPHHRCSLSKMLSFVSNLILHYLYSEEQAVVLGGMGTGEHALKQNLLELLLRALRLYNHVLSYKIQ